MELPLEFGKYKLTSLLGEGGMAQVYRAVLSGPGGFRKQVAIKRMRPHVSKDERLVRFLFNEARLGGHLQHRNVVEVYEFDQVDDDYFLAIEFVDGPTLARVMDHVPQQGSIPPRIAATIAMQICVGLEYAHNAADDAGRPMHLIHRDLKPSNVLIHRDGVVKIADFGVARADTNLSRTTTGMTRGTPQYMSPEQVTGEKKFPLDHRSDQFSLTAILAEMITGETVFEEANLLTLLNKIARVEVGDALEKVSSRASALLPVLRRGFQERPEHRYPSMLEMGRDIRRIYDRLDPTGEERLGPWLAGWLGQDADSLSPSEDSLLEGDSRSLPYEEVADETPDEPEPTRPTVPAIEEEQEPPLMMAGLAALQETENDETETPQIRPGRPVYETAHMEALRKDEPPGKPRKQDEDLGRGFALFMVGAVTVGLLGLAGFVFRDDLAKMVGLAESAEDESLATFGTEETEAVRARRRIRPGSEDVADPPARDVFHDDELHTVLTRTPRPRLRRCVRQHHGENEAAEPITLRYEVDTDGKISNTQVTSPESVDPAVATCIVKIVDKLRLEPTDADAPVERSHTIAPTRTADTEEP